MLLHNTKVGRHALIRDAIIDKNVTVPEWAQVGVDKEHDRARGFIVSPAASPWWARARRSSRDRPAARWRC